MSTYGIQPTGYVRKPLSVILGELEAAMVTEFGPGVVQTPQSPLGQLNGLMADLLAEIDERNLDLYQSYDPDQAEGARLEMLGRIRLIGRGGQSDLEYRQRITNAGEARVDVQDVEAALLGLDGVEFARMYTEATPKVNALGGGTVSIAAIGGSDSDIAAALRQYIVPGISTYGNTRVMAEVGGACRSYSIVRPVEVPVTLELQVRTGEGTGSCPPPSTTAIRQAVVDGWASMRQNGMDVSHYEIRGIIERQFPQVELVNLIGERDAFNYGLNIAVPLGFIEVASISLGDVGVTLL
jgi:hypothetical protein